MEKEVGRRRRVVFNFYDLDHITKGFFRRGASAAVFGVVEGKKRVCFFLVFSKVN